uniref:Uncharacterized protein n=1 Tax=Fagus sylvatica TaxID=28930 RepID=A0A2N9FF39_FAGSY
MPTPGPRSNRVLERFLGLTSEVLCWEIRWVDETWQKSSISLDLLTRYFSWSDFPANLVGDFTVGEQDWEKFRVNAFKIAFAGWEFRCSACSFSSYDSAAMCGTSMTTRLLTTLRGVYFSLRSRTFRNAASPRWTLLKMAFLLDSSVTYEFVEWREGWSPSFIPRPTVQPGTSHFSVPPSHV